MLLKCLKYLFWGISWGCTFFVLTLIAGASISGSEFLEPIMNQLVPQAVGAILVGICCGTSSIVYSIERLSLWVKICIHFLVGLTGYFLVSYRLGWMPRQNWIALLLFLLIGVGSFVAIWFLFYCINRLEAKKLNERLKELEETEEIVK